MIEKEPQHLSRRIWPARVRVGARCTAAGPGVAASMHDPLLQHRRPTIVCMEGAREPASAIRCLAVFHRGPQVAGGRTGLRQDILAVAGVHRRVPIGVEHNGWDGSATCPLRVSTGGGGSVCL